MMTATTPKKAKPGAARRSTRTRGTGSRGPFHCVYLYYFTPGEVRVYESFDPHNQIKNPKNRISQLALNAYEDGNDPPYYMKGSKIKPKHFTMRRKSYVAFVVSNNDWTLNSAINVDFKGNYSSNQTTPTNKSFTTIDSFKIPIYEDVTLENLIVVYCENIMQSSKYDRDLDELEWEAFDMTLPFTPKTKGVRAPDTGGTNLGPPVPPPALLYRRKARVRAAD